MDNAFSLIDEAISHAGEDPRRQELLQRLEQRRITPDKELPPMQFLFELFCKPCFPRGELVAIAGKAKSGKTFICSILMALCFSNEVLTLHRLEPNPLRVLWFDTEQSEESTQDILKNRIIPMIGNSLPTKGEGWGEGLHLDVFNVRAEMWQERLPMLEAAMHQYTPDLVILDGVRDLVNDINDGVMAQDVIERLMHLASDLRCCIVCILHQNKSSEDKNLRGWIGTELKNKAFEVYECQKDSDRVFTWSQTDTRKYDIVDKFKYTVGNDGIPQLFNIEQHLENSHPSQGGQRVCLEGRISINAKYLLGYNGNFPMVDTARLFADAFRPGEVKSAVALQATVMHMANINSYKFYNHRREEAIAQGVIVMGHDANGQIVYRRPL